MPLKHLVKVISAVLISTVILIQPVRSQLTLADVEAIARATTVLIAPDLTARDIATGQERKEAGSGVIIAQQRVSAGSNLKRYWVLTNSHVVGIEEEDLRYGIRTADGAVYPEGGLPDPEKSSRTTYVHKPAIYRFDEDCKDGSKSSCNAGTDLAVLSFYSDQIYPIAAIGDPSEISPQLKILASGWPETVGRSGKRVRFSANGEVKGFLPTDELPEGNYNLVTTIRFKHGASGGPVFNRKGELIGIYGKGQSENEQIGSIENYAIDIGQFLKLQAQPEYKQAFEFTPPALTSSTAIDPFAVRFGQVYQDVGDNITADERKKFAFADILDDDPAKPSIDLLHDKYGCWLNYEGNHTGAGLLESRGAAINDLNACLDRMNDRIAVAAANLVTKKEYEEFQDKVKSLAERVRKLKSGKASVPDQFQQSNSIQSFTPSEASEFIPPSLISFDFRSPGPYSYCLEDIIQLHLSVDGFKQRGRRATCLPEVFTRYQDSGLTRDQARQLIEAANAYATTAFTGVKMYPPKGQRVRVTELFGVRYELDQKKP